MSNKCLKQTSKGDFARLLLAFSVWERLTVWHVPCQLLLALFANGENWHVSNWQIARYMLIAIIRAHRQYFSRG